MPRTGGNLTRQRILKRAMSLFSKNGIDGTSIDDIATETRIHKSSIFYHFKNKHAIIEALYMDILRELDQYIDKSSKDMRRQQKAVTLQDEIKMEIKYMSEKKDILAVMLSEALKNGNSSYPLFECARKVFQGHHKAVPSSKHLTHEFFTGFLPLVTFVVFREKWRRFVRCSDEKLLDYFMQSFDMTHVQSHPEA
jgi:AcrR family transcriptional regulator